MCRVLVGLHFQRGDQWLASADRRVVDQGLDRDAGPGRLRNAAGIGQPHAAGWFSRAALGETLSIVGSVRWEAPEGQVRAGKRRRLGDLRDGEAQAVVRSGPDRDRDVDRDAQAGSDEGEQRGLARFGAHREDRRRAEQFARVATGVGIDGDQACLCVRRARGEGEVSRGALGDRVGVAEEALRGIEDHVACRLGRTWTAQGEGGAEIGMSAGLGVGAGRGERFDRLGGEGRRCTDCEQRRHRGEGEGNSAVHPGAHLPAPRVVLAARLWLWRLCW